MRFLGRVQLFDFAFKTPHGGSIGAALFVGPLFVDQRADQSQQLGDAGDDVLAVIGARQLAEAAADIGHLDGLHGHQVEDVSQARIADVENEPLADKFSGLRQAQVETGEFLDLLGMDTGLKAPALGDESRRQSVADMEGCVLKSKMCTNSGKYCSTKARSRTRFLSLRTLYRAMLKSCSASNCESKTW